MKIGMVSFGGDGAELGAPPPSVGGLASALVRNGHDVVLMTCHLPMRAARSTVEAAYETRTVAELAVSNLDESKSVEHVGVLVRELARELRTASYEVLHSHGWLAGLATQLAAPGSGPPVVHTFHGLRLLDATGDRQASPSRLRAEWASAAHADHLIVTSTFEQQALLRLGVPRRRITVVPPGVGDSDPDGVWRDMASTATGRSAFAPKLVVFGPPSRIADLVRALTMLPGVVMLVCGTPQYPVDDATIGMLTALAGTLGVADRVRLEQGDTASVRASLIRDAAVAICLAPPARAGTEHLEAMALGVPVVAGNVVAAEAVVDGLTGLHAVGVTARDLVVLVRKLLNNHVGRSQMAVAGQDHIASRYHWDRIATETERVYLPLLATLDTPPVEQH
jgi:glycosyltransferase involved in cell wall biosynthesis